MTLLSSRQGKPRGTGNSDMHALLAAQPDQHGGPDEDWELEYRRSQTALAMDQVRPDFSEKVWSAFWKTAVEARSADEAGRELKMSTGAVYVAKSRVLARLREVVQRRLEEHEE
jgi:DNA-directed RNA polymerase specialized sigma24 family protein